MAQENLEQQIEELKARSEEYLNGWKRERADFLNYKKEEAERISGFMKYANEEIILNIIPILDNLCLAANHIKDDGLNQIKKQLEDFLKKEGIEPIEVTGKEFDPNTMEAIDTDAPSSDGATTTVVELQRGYTMHGKIIRVAKVKLNK